MKHLAALLALPILACGHPVSPAPATKVEVVKQLTDKTVALVHPEEPDDDGEILPVRAYCTGVWIGVDTVLTAEHCVNETKLGEKVLYVVERDVYAYGGHVTRSKVTPRASTLKAVDPIHDLALLKAAEDPGGHGVAKLSSSEVLAGQTAQTVGQSVGFLWWSYSSGDVAAIRWADASGDGPMFWVQTTAPVSPGNSGGGLFNDRAELIGICHGGYRRGQLLNIFVHPMYIETFLSLYT